MPPTEHDTAEWQHRHRWKSQQSSSPEDFNDAIDSWLGWCLAILQARKIRRCLLFFTVVFISSLWLWSIVVWPTWKDRRALDWSLSDQNRLTSGGVFGSNLPPVFPNIIQLKVLDPKYIPKAKASQHPTANNVNRLVFVGDVHGCLDELKDLMQKVNFNSERDHLITTGDLIAKGPDSLGTVDFVRQMGASCVRGNHEDRILLIAQGLEEPIREGSDTRNELSTYSLDSPARTLAASLSAEHILYLKNCPVILRVGFVESLASDLIVVHAGLVPGIRLERQDPTTVMTMRSIDLGTHVPSKDAIFKGGVHWAKLWNAHQETLHKRSSFF